VPVEEWKGVLNNDFEESVFVQFPEIAAAKQKLYDEGAVYAAMSGSGSAVYGIFIT
jgi:4-diphosphocytidyl-2-C-methyl-D-erythritol kinase